MYASTATHPGLDSVRGQVRCRQRDWPPGGSRRRPCLCGCSQKADLTRNGSELKSHSQLNGARSTDLVQGTESSADDSSCTKAGRQRPRRLSKQAAAQRVRRQAKTGLIEEVERFEPQ